MKAKLFILTLLACALAAQAQGTLQFYARATGANEVPPNNDPTIAAGTFTLEGNILNFRLNVPAVTFSAQSAYIQGPALPGVNAPVIFDLGGPVFHSGSSFGDPPPYYAFFSPFDGTFGAGPFTLTSGQIDELVSGLWYVHITSFERPEGQLRGQILPVPEPSALALLIMGFGIIGLRCGKRKT